MGNLGDKVYTRNSAFVVMVKGYLGPPPYLGEHVVTPPYREGRLITPPCREEGLVIPPSREEHLVTPPCREECLVTPPYREERLIFARRSASLHTKRVDCAHVARRVARS